MPTRLRAFAIVLPVAVALGGCAVTDKFTELPNTKNLPNVTDAPTAIEKADKLRAAYRKDIEATREMQLWFDVPLIGLAAGTLASVVYKGSKDLTLGLGLATGTVAAARTYTNPSDRIAALNKGMKAATCVQTSMLGLPEKGPDTNQAKADAATARTKLQEALPNGADGESARLFGAAQNRLTAALAKIESVIVLADLAETLRKAAPQTANATLVNIAAQVDSLIVGSSQDLAAAIAQIEKGAISARDLIGRRDELRGSDVQSAGIQKAGDPDAQKGEDGNKKARDSAKAMSDLAVGLETLADSLTTQSKDIESKNTALVRCGVI